MADNNPILRYPEDIAYDHADWVKFEFFNYMPPFKADAGKKGEPNTAAALIAEYNASVTGLQPLEKANGYPSIAMYMPEDVASNYSQNWGGREFHPIAAAALRSSGQMFGDVADAAKKGGLAGASAAATTGIGTMVNSLTNQALGGVGGTMKTLTAGAISNALNSSGFAGGITANDVLASQGGSILNPNTEVLYQGPQLRNFAFNYKMVARNEKESNNIREICQAFKRASLPRALGEGEKNLIGVPHIVKFTFKHKSEDNKWIAQYKHCAIGSVNITYTPDGTWATYRDGSPVAIILQLQFQELKLIFENEISADPTKSGY
jgi:hypothetical protein